MINEKNTVPSLTLDPNASNAAAAVAAVNLSHGR